MEARNPGATLIFSQLHRRLLLESLADVLGVDVEVPELPPERLPSDRDQLFEDVLAQLRHVVVPRLDDGFAQV